MIPILYSESEQDFTTLGLGVLSDVISCEVHTVLNGMFELEMQYPVSGRRYSDLKISNIIKADAEKNGTAQLFDIYEITRPISGIVTVYASHVSGRKQFIPIMPCSAANIVDAFAAIDSHAAETNPFTFWTDKSTIAPFNLKIPASLGAVLGGMEGSILDVYRGEYEFDNFTIKFRNRRGADNGVSLRYGKNITSIEQEESIASTITGICPYWVDIDGNNAVTLPEKVVESANADNFPFKRTVVKDFSLTFEEQPTVAQLRSAAESYVESSDIGVPKVGIDVSYENLSDYEGYQDIALLEQVRLGDTVHVFFEPLNITATARVTETYYNPLLNKYKRIRVGSVKSTLATIINGDAATAKQDVSNVTAEVSNALDEAVNLLSGADGGNIVINRNNLTGKPYEILIMDTDNVSSATKVLRLNMNGLGLSTSGINGPYTDAITGEGIIATAIKTGILSDLNGLYSLNMQTGTVNMASANITGGTIDIETSAANDDRIILRYRGDMVNYEWEMAISPSAVNLTRKLYTDNTFTTLSSIDEMEIASTGITYTRNRGLVSRYKSIRIDNSGVSVSLGTDSVEISESNIQVFSSNGRAELTADGIYFYDDDDNLIKSL